MQSQAQSQGQSRKTQKLAYMDRRASRLAPTEPSASRHLNGGKSRGFLIPQYLMILRKANQTTIAPTYTTINRSRYSLLGFPGNTKLRIVTSSFREAFPVLQVNLNWIRKTMMTHTLHVSSLPLDQNRNVFCLIATVDEVIHGGGGRLSLKGAKSHSFWATWRRMSAERKRKLKCTDRIVEDIIFNFVKSSSDQSTLLESPIGS